MIRTLTQIAQRVALADTNYNALIASAARVDSKLVSVMCANTTGGAVIFTIALVPTGTTAAAAYDVKATSVAAGATVNVIDGFELPVPAGYTLYVKSASATGTYVHAFGVKASEGTVGLRAVIG